MPDFQAAGLFRPPQLSNTDYTGCCLVVTCSLFIEGEVFEFPSKIMLNKQHFQTNYGIILPNQKILVTSALPYANGPIHLGHLSGAYLPADIYVRYQRLKGRDILFICGSDEHGVPITISADKENVTPKTIIDRYHSINIAAFEKFGMSFDNYSRTSLPIHHETGKEFFLESKHVPARPLCGRHLSELRV